MCFVMFWVIAVIAMYFIAKSCGWCSPQRAEVPAAYETPQQDIANPVPRKDAKKPSKTRKSSSKAKKSTSKPKAKGKTVGKSETIPKMSFSQVMQKVQSCNKIKKQLSTDFQNLARDRLWLKGAAAAMFSKFGAISEPSK